MPPVAAASISDVAAGATSAPTTATGSYGVTLSPPVTAREHGHLVHTGQAIRPRSQPADPLPSDRPLEHALNPTIHPHREHAVSGPQPSTRADQAAPDTVGDLIRWAAFTCVLVPVVLVWYGTSLAGATGTALGLAAVTGACRLLLRQSERVAAQGAARPSAQNGAPRRGRHGRGGSGSHRGGRHSGRITPID